MEIFGSMTFREEDCFKNYTNRLSMIMLDPSPRPSKLQRLMTRLFLKFKSQAYRKRRSDLLVRRSYLRGFRRFKRLLKAKYTSPTASKHRPKILRKSLAKA
jgi:hypothetical protein